MRNATSAAVIVIGVAVLSLSGAQAQDLGGTTTPSGHVKQHQDVVPLPQDGSSQDQKTQSAQAPQAPGVIAPPPTGDRGVIMPPATGDAKTPVIAPPGTPGDKNNVEPK